MQRLRPIVRILHVRIVDLLQRDDFVALGVIQCLVLHEKRDVDEAVLGHLLA